MSFARAEVLGHLEPTHTVQFYEDPDYLCRVVADFMVIGLDAGQPAIVVASRNRCDSITKCLGTLGCDAGRLQSDGRLTVLDARAALPAITSGRRIDRDRFRKRIGAELAKLAAARPRSTIRAYGELVDVLWGIGNHEGALRVEELWHEMALEYPLSLLCGYSIDHFCRDEHELQMHEVCAWHTHVLPTERFMALEREAQQLRAVARLQQRATALEHELERRRNLEQALRLALDERERSERARESLLAREQLARTDAESASRLKDEFLAVLSHEMRTPLNAILGWAQIINESVTDLPTMRRGIDVIQRNAASQLHLVEDLLDVSRIITGRMVIRTDIVNLADVVNAAVDAVRPSAAGKNLALTLTIDPDVRPVVGDADRLRQCTWNLLSNAVKFTSANGHIDVRVVQLDELARIVVSDDGQGIGSEFLPHVFDRFRQADAGATRVHGGLGLGLAVVRYLVEAHGGSASAASEGHGCGATFTISLPTRSDVRVQRTHPAGFVPLTSARVLIVDDDANSRELFEYMLNQLGAVVVAVASAEAERLLNMDTFDVMVSEIGIPGRNEFALIERVRRHPNHAVRDMRAIAATSYTGDHYRNNALAAGFDDFVAKPVEPRYLAERVATLLRKAG
jgi:signal transduction histidine kinase/CheY-like chemotaxis protein